MKIKSIAALCKKVRHAVIMDSASADGSIVQFIGDGNAAYICDGLPTVEEESLLAIFDVPQEQRNTWHVKRSNVYDMVDRVIPATNEAVRSAVIFFYIANEGLSILENAGELGLPLPAALKKSLEKMQDKEEKPDIDSDTDIEQ